MALSFLVFGPEDDVEAWHNLTTKNAFVSVCTHKLHNWYKYNKSTKEEDTIFHFLKFNLIFIELVNQEAKLPPIVLVHWMGYKINT